MSPLVRGQRGLLRAGEGLAGSLSCCCKESDPKAYSTCGHFCALRVTNGPLDSEMAACGENIPSGWSVTQSQGCTEFDDRGTSFYPFLTAQKQNACDSSPINFEDVGGFGGLPYCYEVRSAGINHLLALFGFFGASVDRFYSGYKSGTFNQNTNTGLLQYEQISLQSYMGIEVFCQDSLFQTRDDLELCGTCGGTSGVKLYPGKYLVRAFMTITANETKFDSENSANNDFGFRELRRSLYFSDDLFGQVEAFKVQTCEEKSDFTRFPQYTAGGLGLPEYRDVESECAVYRDFYPDSPTEFTVSLDKLTVNGQDFEWSLSEEENWADDGVFGYGITPDIPSELESFDTVTVYLAENCCTGDYCNPLP